MTDDEIQEYEYDVEFRIDRHNEQEIKNNLFIGLKNWEEWLSVVILKLFDLLLEKDFNFAIHNDLILKYFEGFEVIERHPDLTSFLPKYLTYYDQESLESYFEEA